MESPIYRLQETIDEYANRHEQLDDSAGEGTVEYPPEGRETDLAVNFAMKVADRLGSNPREVAGELADYLRDEADYLESVELAGPGFVNCDFDDEFLIESIGELLDRDGLPLRETGEGDSVLLEFVSANPTGPLHVGHGRGAVYGDVVGRLLEAHGYDVTREYYVNDTGGQIRRLAESLNLRAREQAGEEVEFGEDHYKGDYVGEIVEEAGLTPETSLEECAEVGIDRILSDIFDVLDQCDIDFDTTVHESEVAPREELDELIEDLRARDCVREENGAVFLKTTEEGDDKDRVLIKDDGDPTYFANDLLYHHKKYERGFGRYLDVWGHDHHGYQARVRAGLAMLGHDLDRFEIELYQLVDLYRGGEPVSMSTRQGDFVPLDDLLDEVGIDAVRFNFLTKNNDRPLDFDIEVATSEDEENPVYYVQYAHTRMAGILREEPQDLSGDFGTTLSSQGHELLLKALNYRYHLHEAARSRDPHRVTHYLIDLARRFHSYYAEHRVIDPDDPSTTRLRLRIVRFLKTLFVETLNTMGVSAPDRM